MQCCAVSFKWPLRDPCEHPVHGACLCHVLFFKKKQTVCRDAYQSVSTLTYGPAANGSPAANDSLAQLHGPLGPQAGATVGGSAQATGLVQVYMDTSQLKSTYLSRYALKKRPRRCGRAVLLTCATETFSLKDLHP